MVEQLLADGIADKSEIKHQFLDAQNISSVGTTSTLPIFKIQDKEYLEPVDRWEIAKNRNIYVGTNSSFVWNHPIFGLWGITAGTQSVWGSTNTTAWVIQRIIQPNNIYNEIFYDTQFYGSITNGTWDITNHRATLGANGTISSSQIYMNNSTVNTALLIASYNGTVNWFMSANGGTAWQTCNSGTEITFSTAGTDLRWRATSNAATITSLNIEFT